MHFKNCEKTKLKAKMPSSTPTPPTIGLNNARIEKNIAFIGFIWSKKNKKCGYRKFSVEPFKSYGEIKKNLVVDVNFWI